MDESEHDVLAYMTFPAAYRTKLHSTSRLKRLHGKIKRRTKVVGILLNEEAITRLIGSILLEQNAEWVVQRARYMTLESTAPVSEIGPEKLPVVADWQTRPCLQNTATNARFLHHQLVRDRP